MAIKWRNSRQLTGVQAQVQGAINGCRNGATVEIDLKTARNMIEIIEQLKHIEVNHEPLCIAGQTLNQEDF